MANRGKQELQFEDDETKEFVSQLNYLLDVGFPNEVVQTMMHFYSEECFNKESIVEDLEDIEDSQITGEVQSKHAWIVDEKLQEFYLKTRQALGLDDKPKAETLPIPTADQIDYTLSKEEHEKYRQAYRAHCHCLLPMDHNGADDRALLTAMAIGRKNRIPLLQNIADTYCRVRINEYLQNQQSDLQPSAFCKKYEFMKTLAKSNKEKADVLESALQSFHKRICPKMEFSALLRIDDSLSDFFSYTTAVIRTIHNVVKTKEGLPPFQVFIVSMFYVDRVLCTSVSLYVILSAKPHHLTISMSDELHLGRFLDHSQGHRVRNVF